MSEKEMFRVFQEESLYWQKYLGLGDWRIFFGNEELKDEEDSTRYAEITFNWDARFVTINLNKNWNGKTELEVRRVAFHEVCHMLISEISSYTYHRDFEEHQHIVIRRLENSVFCNDERILNLID